MLHVELLQSQTSLSRQSSFVSSKLHCLRQIFDAALQMHNVGYELQFAWFPYLALQLSWQDPEVALVLTHSHKSGTVAQVDVVLY